ncbi:MAG: septal ring lytic transglycosylase RlpA family protein [Spirochaetia bacterium]|jgi:rare lipoprotein A
MKRLVPFILLLIAAVLGAEPGLEGFASWYGGKFHGRLTSSGEVFDTNDMTAAHRTLPFGTMVKVTNLDNGKFAVVKINDRGPFVEGRIIDLSRAAAEEIDMLGQGVARVSLDIVAFATDKDVYAIQVGAFGMDKNAEKARLALEAAGFVVTIEKTGLSVARVLVRGIPATSLSDTRRKLEDLGFAQYFLKKERTESPRNSERNMVLPVAQSAPAMP